MSINKNIKFKEPQDSVYFFKMNGCGHCEHLKPIWDEAVKLVKKSNPSVVYIEIESSDIPNIDKETKDKLKAEEIVGFPDLRILKKNGTMSKFESNRTVEELVKWIKENTKDSGSPSIKRIATPYPGKTRRSKGGRKSRKSRRKRRKVTRKITRRRI
jgi:thiol-disulfide isomerase/thioredoxin